jgi:hypothetical protein
MPSPTSANSSLLFDDQLVFRVDGDLHVIAHRNVRMRRHHSAVGVGERDLALPTLVQFRQRFCSEAGSLISSITNLFPAGGSYRIAGILF